MGNDILAIIFGVVLMVIGVVVAIFTGTRMVAQAKLFEFLPALQGYVIGMIIAIVFFVSGLVILLLFASSS